ncbi:MAG: ABC-2 family transporter protein [Elusimicrobia bacterium]|nr:ABC-2 family transporter protein [Elusimicrobiota bacterium]
MRKYLYVFGLSLQNVLQHRATLLMDRVGGLAAILALYYFWEAILRGKDEFLGYSRPQILTYVLLMNLMRSFVFTGRGWELVQEISHGRISSYLLRPLSYQGYSLSLDLAQKTIHLLSALLEVGVLALLFEAPIYWPARLETWALFVAAVAASSLLFFFLEFVVACLAFWTSESGGPLFCFELFLNFAAGSFFPIDVLPSALQAVLRATPFPYLVFFPINIYLERVGPAEAVRLLAVELGWLALAWLATQLVWRRGLRTYAAEGG